MATLRHRLALQGSRTTTQETLETNTLFDFEDSRLTKNGCALRMRSYGQMRLLTYKGPVQDDPLFKRRLELQTNVSDPDTMHQILASLGLEPRFKYSKIREIQSLTIGENRVEVSLDETPVGFFVELEGEPSTITKAIKILSLDDKSAVINLHYLPNKIREAARNFSASTSLKIDFSPESQILGTSGALRHAKDLLKGREIVILNGKIYSEIDLSLALDVHRENDALITLVVLPFPSKTNFNPVRIAKDGSVLGFGPGNSGIPTLFTGIQIWNREVLLNLPKGPSDSVKDIYPSLIEQGKRIYSHLSRDYWCECSTPDRYWRNSMEMLGRGLKSASHVSCLDPSRKNVIRGAKVEIETGSQIIALRIRQSF